MMITSRPRAELTKYENKQRNKHNSNIINPTNKSTNMITPNQNQTKPI